MGANSTPLPEYDQESYFGSEFDDDWQVEHEWAVDRRGRVQLVEGEIESDCDCDRACQKERARQLMLTEIEFMDAPEFRDPELAEEILAPAPARRDDQPADIKPAPPGTPPYLEELYSVALLTPEQEAHLFRKMNYLKYHAEVLRRKINPSRPNVGRLDQIEALVDDALRIRNQIVRANLRLVVSIAKTLIDQQTSLDFLISEGNVPLIRAVEIFDFTRGLRFSTYATWAIRNCLHRAVPRARKIRGRFRSGVEGVFEGHSDQRSRRAEEGYHRDVRDAVEQLLPAVSEREQHIVRQRFGLIDDRPRRFREIGEELELSTERVRQLFVRSIDRLKEAAEENGVELPDF